MVESVHLAHFLSSINVDDAGLYWLGSGNSNGQDNLRTQHHFVDLMWVVLGIIKHSHLAEAPQNTVYVAILIKTGR